MDLDRLRYLLHELRSWSSSGLIDTPLRERLAHPYEAERVAIIEYLESFSGYGPSARPVAPRCHEPLAPACAFCPDCGVNLLSRPAQPAAEAVRVDEPPASRARSDAVTASSLEAPPEVAAREPVLPPAAPAAPPVAVARTAEETAEEIEPAPAPRQTGRLLRELRPVFYENLILFVGAFLMFAGSIYFAVYFWDRLGQFGSLVAGGLLAVYGLSFAATGYLLQRRYHAELSARVLYGVATAILPVASTLLGEPIRTGGAAMAILAAGTVALLGAVAYPAIFTAASLFQREIGRPFAGSVVALLWAIGLAPLVAISGIRGLAIAYVYLAAIPVLAMYRQVREVGRVFERATVVYIVGGSAYLVLGVAARVSLAVSPGIAPAELAPLLVLIATAAIDLDVAWRDRSRAVRSVLGVIGVLAHGAALLAIVIALVDPRWRVVTTLSAGLVFAVTALRHRRPSAVHLAIATVVAGASMIAWLPILDPPHAVAFGGLFLLPLSVGLTRLGARWRRHAAVEFAAPCELWATLCPILAAVTTLLPLLGAMWQIEQLEQLGRIGAYAPAVVVLPLSAAALALAWAWGRRRHSLAAAAIAAAATVLVVVRLIGGEALALAMTSAVVTLAIVGAAVVCLRRGAAEASRALIDASFVPLAATVVILVATRIGPWHGASAAGSAAGFALLAGAAVAVASQRPRREVGIVAVLALAMAAAAALWWIVPHELLPGILAAALLVLDRTKARAAIGNAQPLQDAYAIALGAIALQVIAIFATTTALTSVSPVAAGLVALALFAVAARHASPWPTYGALAWLVAAAYGIPEALDLALRPKVVAEVTGLAVIVVALALRAWPRLQPWRTTFLDVPLHLAAIAAPLVFLRLLWAFGVWEASDAPQTYLLVRRLVPPLGFAVLAAITHGSRVHAYLAAASAAFVLPAIVAILGLGGAAVPAALAASGVMSWIAVHAIARRPAFAEPVARGDLPLWLFGVFALPSAPTRGDVWRGPIGELGLLAAVAAGVMSLQRSVALWPEGSTTSAATYVLLAVYAIARCIKPVASGRPFAPSLAAHAACAALALLATEIANLSGATPGSGGVVLLGSGFLLLGEALARVPHAAACPGARAALQWALALLIVPMTVLVRPTDLATPSAAAILAVAVVRYGRHYPVPGARTAASVAILTASGFLVLWLLGRATWLAPEGVAIAALGTTAAIGGWMHWFLRERTHLGEPFGLVSAWAVLGCALAVVSSSFDIPASAPGALPTILAIAALLPTTVWFGFAAIRTAHRRYGYAAQATLVLLYVCIRRSPLGAGLSADADATVAIGSAFALHFLSELLQRARLTGLERPAVLGARTLPILACAVVLGTAGDGEMATLQHAALAATLGLLYTLGFRRGGHRALGIVAVVFYNVGLVLLWLSTDRRDALFYVIPVGVSLGLLARIYQANLSRSARRGLRTAGALLIYFATYYQVVQFDQGLYPVLLGGFTLVGIIVGFALQLRELFVLSAGFLVLDVISNLAYYGVHRPVLGWTLVTVAGLCFTASGIVFQLRRAQVRRFVADVRSALAKWD